MNAGEREGLDVASMRAGHRDSWPMGNIHHGTPENPSWGTFCIDCKQSWPCEVSLLLDALEAAERKVAAVETLADEWQKRWDDGRASDDPVQRYVRCGVAADRLRAALAAEDTSESPPRTHGNGSRSDSGPESGQGDHRDDEGRSGAQEEGK